MKVEINQKELLDILNEKFDSDIKIDEVSIKVVLEDGFNDYILFRKDDWFVGSFIEKEILNKNKGE